MRALYADVIRWWNLLIIISSSLVYVHYQAHVRGATSNDNRGMSSIGEASVLMAGNF
jgi:hypothetical protein